MQKKLNTYNIKFIGAMILVLLSFISVKAQIKEVQTNKITTEKAQNKQIREPIDCEYLILILDVMAVYNDSLVIQTRSGDVPVAVFVISSGNGKSNVKLANKLKKALDNRLKFVERYRNLRYEIVDSKPVKGDGRFQIFFLDEKQDYEFGNTIFSCS